MKEKSPLERIFLKHSNRLDSLLGEQEWISASEFAEKSGFTPARARALLQAGKIKGARKVGTGKLKVWLVPSDVKWRPKKVGRPGWPNDEAKFIKILNKKGPPKNWIRSPLRNFGQWLYENKPDTFRKRYNAWLKRIDYHIKRMASQKEWAIENKAWMELPEEKRICGLCGHTHIKLPFNREDFYYCDCCGSIIFKNNKEKRID